MKTVHIARNPLDLSDQQTFQTDDVHELIARELPEWPPTARIYHREITQRNDVTPIDEATIERLSQLEGPLYVVVYPAAAQVLGAAAVYAVAFVISAILADRTPKPREQIFYSGSPNNELSKRTNRARIKERIPDGYGVYRSVPDLIQWAYITYENHFPVETSLMCIGVGDNPASEVRDGDINFTQIKDASAVVYPPGQTPGGGTPNLIIGTMITDPPYTVIPVTAINHQQLPPLNAFKCHGTGRNGISRQGTVGGSILVGAGVLGDWTGMIFRSDGVIIVPTNGDPDFVKSRIRVGDELQVAWGTVPSAPFTPTGGLPAGAATPPDLSAGWGFGIAEFEPFPATVGFPANGRVDLDPLVVTNVVTLNVLEVAVTCTIPASLSFQWARISPWSTGGWTHNGVPAILNKNCYITAQNRWPVGYILGLTTSSPMGIFVDDPLQTELWMNIVAPRGLYIEDGVNRKTLTETVAWFLQPCDQNGIPTASPGESGIITLKGSLIGGETRAVTVKIARITTGRCLLLVCRTSQRVRQEDVDPNVTTFFRPRTFNLAADSPIGQSGSVTSFGDLRDTAFTGNVTDDLELAEVYSMSRPTFVNSDCTLIHTKTIHNASAARVQERQVNCLVGRSIPTWNGAGFNSPTINSAAENILFQIMQDPFIGNRSAAEINFAGIAATFLAIRNYFGDQTATDFSYTFDDHNTSFEETVAIICNATFATPYRQGNVLNCDPDIATDNSSGLFNHRNKMPGTEARTVTFGRTGENDGVEQPYVDVDKGADTFIPISQENGQPTVVSPLQSRVVGLRFRYQAAWHAYRQLARLTFQHTAVEFEATQEAATVNLKQRLLIEDNTRPDVQDGEIEDIVGLVVRTSQRVTLVGGSTYTLFLYYTDGTAQGTAVTAGPDAFSLTLGSAPVMSLVTNPALGRLTKYILVRDQNATGKAFLVTEKTNNNQMTYNLTAINYSHMYYHADGLIAFLPVSTQIGGQEFFDRSPYERVNNGNIINLASDVLRGPCYNDNASGPGILLDSVIAAALLNYSKACWVKMAAATVFPILSSTSTGHEHFEISSTGQIRAGHGNAGSVTLSAISSALVALNTWCHVAVTFNSVTGVMRLYFNGDLVLTATSVPNRTLASVTAFNSTFGGRTPANGRADNLRHYCRELSPAMVRELYQKELIL